jgi:hypothetical protein
MPVLPILLFYKKFFEIGFVLQKRLSISHINNVFQPFTELRHT